MDTPHAKNGASAGDDWKTIKCKPGEGSFGGVHMSVATGAQKTDPRHDSPSAKAEGNLNRIGILEDVDIEAAKPQVEEQEIKNEEEPKKRKPKQPLNDRLRYNDPELIRLDITAQLMQDWTDWRREDFFHACFYNTTVQTVHFSGNTLDTMFSEEMMDYAMEAIGQLANLQELFVFRGGSKLLTEERLAKCLSAAEKANVLMIWGFGGVSLNKHPVLAGAMRHHPSLERVTVTLPCGLPWACMDVYAMGFSEMERLQVLNIRCHKGQQQEAIISPEAISLLLSSKSIESLYLENCGLIDDHTDAICEELRNNRKLGLLDIKHNLFSDDAMYSFAALLKINQTLSSVDISGVGISEGGGWALALAMESNTQLRNLELEGYESRFRDEFDIPVGHTQTDWFQALDFQLRLNRAGRGGSLQKRNKFVEAISMVSDNEALIYYFLRGHAHHCDRRAPVEYKQA